ncbi:methyltransferase family protein [Methanobacterium oryzae]|uniref:methyltransferase family protein n=1 Tax=Methanobacterium oryzae TaxID=69540 RepID=UPI003D1DE360
MSHNMPDEPNWRFMIISYSITFLFIAQIILCLFFYNWAGIDLLAYLGWIILILGIIILWKSQVDFRAMSKKEDGKNWLDTINVVDYGIYSIIRHPMYLSFMLMAIGLGLISQYLLNVIIGIVRILMLYYVMIEEEKMDLKKLGPEYEDYIKKVPRLNFIKGILRSK